MRTHPVPHPSPSLPTPRGPDTVRPVLKRRPVTQRLRFMAKLSVRDLDVAGKRVLMRVDYNVPMEEKNGVMVINDTTRIKETLPTLQLLTSKGARLILAAHLGRPDGKREPSMSLRPVAEKLAEMLGKPVAFVDETVGEKAEAAVAA